MFDDALEEAAELNELAWGLIANAYGGDWDKAPEEWRAAAIRWRDRWVGGYPVPYVKSMEDTDV